jgi:hypothetical protein
MILASAIFDLSLGLPYGSEILPISDSLNLSMTSSFIQMGDSLSRNQLTHHFALSVHDQTIFMGCSCIHSAYAYHRKGPTDPWEVQQKFSPLTIEEDDFGTDVTINNNAFNSLHLAFVGSPSYNNSTGAVYLFREDSIGNWSLVNILSVGSPGDRFGSSVFLDNFNQFAVGAPNATSKGKGQRLLSLSPNLCTSVCLLHSTRLFLRVGGHSCHPVQTPNRERETPRWMHTLREQEYRDRSAHCWILPNFLSYRSSPHLLRFLDSFFIRRCCCCLHRSDVDFTHCH